jgi:hypothetical protein
VGLAQTTDRTADLEAALSFVTRRIQEQARRAGQPLNEEERLLLKDLPSSEPGYVNSGWNAELGPPPLVPRNINLERLCALGRAAYLHDRELHPISLDWEFAYAVCKLNRHAMAGLLQWVGVKYRRPRWDGILLVIAALLLIVAAMGMIFLLGIEPWTNDKWVAFGLGWATVIFLAYQASRRIERKYLQNEIERCRLAARIIAS